MFSLKQIKCERSNFLSTCLSAGTMPFLPSLALVATHQISVNLITAVTDQEGQVYPDQKQLPPPLSQHTRSTGTIFS